MDPLSKGQDALELFDFGVLLQSLSCNLKHGVLAVRSGAREKFLHLEGATLRCVYTAKPRVTLQKVLFNHRAVERATLRTAAEELGPRRTEDQLAVWLLQRGFVSPEQVSRARRYQVVEEVLELFYWKSVGFEFHADHAWPRAASGLDVVAVGEPTPIDAVLVQCTKTTDDIAKFNSVTPSLRDVYELQFASLQELEQAVPDPAQREFMLLIDGLRDMREVLQDMRMNRYEVLELFYTFRTAGRIRPKNAFELLMLAENRRGEFSWEKRMRVLERVNEIGVEGFGVVLPLAETYEALGRNDKAAAAFSRHARLAADSRDVEGALKSARHAVELAPGSAEHQRLVIDLLLRAGREGEAASTYAALGEILATGGDLDDARDALERAVALAPQDAGYRRRLGEVLAQQGDPRLGALRVRQAGDLHIAQEGAQRAAECYQRALVLWPRAWSVRPRLADAHHLAGRDDVAIQVLADHVAHVSRDLADRGPDFGAARLAEAEEALRRLGGFASSAARHLAEAWRSIGRDEDAARTLREGALGLLAANRPASAVELCQDLIDICPEDHRARRIAAQAHAKLGDRNQALAQLRRVTGQLVHAQRWDDALTIYGEMLEIDPASLDARLGLARALLHVGLFDEAAEEFRRAVLLHRGCGREREALPALREAVATRTGDARLLTALCELLVDAVEDEQETLSALGALVELHMVRGEHAQAAVALGRILEIDPDCPGASEMMAEAARGLAGRAADGGIPVVTEAVAAGHEAAES